MAFCGKCGSQISEENVFCPKCGALLEQGESSASADARQPSQQSGYNSPYNQQPIQQSNTYQQYNQQSNQYGGYNAGPYQAPPPVDNTGILVWSILTTLFCCLPLGIVGIVLSSQAKSAVTPEEAQNKLKNAKLMCIIGDVLGFIFLIIYFIFIFAEM